MSSIFLSTLDGQSLLFTKQTPTPETPAGLDRTVLCEIDEVYRRHFKITDIGVLCLAWERGETEHGLGASMRTVYTIDVFLRVGGHLLLTHTRRSLLLVIVRHFG